MSAAHSDRNLLFGILALQMDFISRDALIQAMHAWVLEKTKPLGQLLVEQGAMAEDARTLLEPLVQKHLQIHIDDPAKSLASFGSPGSVRQVLDVRGIRPRRRGERRIGVRRQARRDPSRGRGDLVPR